MLINALDKVAGHPGVQSSVALVRHNIYRRLFHGCLSVLPSLRGAAGDAATQNEVAETTVIIVNGAQT